MADVKKTVEIVFGATDEMSSKMSGMIGKFGDFSSTVAGGTKTLLKFEAGVAAAGGAMAATAIVAAGKFHDSFAEITTLVDAPKKSIAALKAEILSYGASSTQSLQDVTSATYSALSAGTDYKDITAALTGAEKLAVAGNASMNESVKLLSGTMNAYGADVSQTSKYSDTFFQTVKLGVTTIPELTASLSQVTPVSAQLGISINEVGAAMADMTAKGTPTAQAATQLKALLLALVKPSVGSAKAMKDMGINFSLAEIKAHGLSGVLDQLQKATGGSAEKLNLLIPSSEGAAAAAQLLANNSEKYRLKLDSINSSMGSTDIAFKKMGDNFSLHNQRLLNSINTTLVRVGSDLLPAYGSVADAVAGVFAAFGTAIDGGALTAITTQVQSWSEGLVQFLQDAAKNLPTALSLVDFQPFLDAIGGVGTALGGMFGNTDTQGAQGLADLIQTIIDGMTGFVHVTEGIFSALGILADGVLLAVDVWNSLNGSFQTVLGTIGGMSIVFSSLAPVIGVVTTSLASMVSGMEGMSKSSSMLTKTLGRVGLAGAFIAAGEAGYSFGTFIEKHLSQSTKNAMQDFIGVIDRMTGGLISNADAAKAYGNDSSGYDKATKSIAINGTAIRKTAAEMRSMMDTANKAGISESDYAARMAEVSANALESAGSTRTATDATKLATKAVAGYIDVIGQNGFIKSVRNATNATKGYIRVTGADGTVKTLKIATAAEIKHGAEIDKKAGQLRLMGAEISKANDVTKQYIKIVGSDGGVSYQNNPFYVAGKAAKNAVSEIKKLDVAVAKNKLEAQKLRLEWDKQRNQTIVKTLQIKSKVDIAQIQADSKAVTAAFDSINVGLKTSGALLGNMFGALAKPTSSWKQFAIEDAIRKEQNIREREVKSQEDLNKSIIEMNKAKAERMRNNVNPVLTVSAPDLSVELELVLLKILEKLQIKGNASGMDMLLQGL